MGTPTTFGDNPLKHADPKGESFVDCKEAIKELINATSNLNKRVAEKVAHAGEVDLMNHAKSIQQAENRVQNALDKVKRNCGCFAGGAAAIAAAVAAIEAAAPYLFEAAAAAAAAA